MKIVDLETAAEHFRTLASSPADSAEDAAGVADGVYLACVIENVIECADPGTRGEHDEWNVDIVDVLDDLRRAAALLRQSSAAVAKAVRVAVASEREACAKECEAEEQRAKDEREKTPYPGDLRDRIHGTRMSGARSAANECARRIRARADGGEGKGK